MTARKGQYGGRRILEGTVVSDKNEKTVVVAVKSSVRHPLYKKIVRRVRKFMAHDDQLDAHMGDIVRIVESRPLSKRKRWRVIEVLYRADLPEVAAESIDLELLGEVKTEEETPEEETAPADLPAATAAEEAPAAEGPVAEAAPEPEASTEALEEPPVVEEAEEVAPAEVVPEAEAGEEPKAEESVAEEPVAEEPVAEHESEDSADEREAVDEEAE